MGHASYGKKVINVYLKEKVSTLCGYLDTGVQKVKA